MRKQTVRRIHAIHWVWSPHTNSDHQDYYIFRFGNPNINLHLPRLHPVGSEGDEAEIVHLNEHLLQGELPSSWENERLDVSKNMGKFPPQIIHLFIGFSLIFTIHFGGLGPPLFLETSTWNPKVMEVWLEDDFHPRDGRQPLFRLQVMEANGRFPTNFRWRPITYPWEPYAWEATPCVWPCRMCFGQWLVDCLGYGFIEEQVKSGKALNLFKPSWWPGEWNMIYWLGVLKFDGLVSMGETSVEGERWRTRGPRLRSEKPRKNQGEISILLAFRLSVWQIFETTLAQCKTTLATCFLWQEKNSLKATLLDEGEPEMVQQILPSTLEPALRRRRRFSSGKKVLGVVSLFAPGDSKWPFYPLFAGHLTFERVT